MEDFLVYFYQNKETIFVIVLSIFLGVEVISNVPSVLHTPLMSGANAISGVIIIGGIILLGHTDLSSGISLNLILGIFAVIFGTLNVVGGFVVTDRMLDMFKKKKKK
ncbi:MAG: NAD(P) transhydrogenase subunit alpha [Bacteroidales bacterium]|nr:NAD(P) transhydrogenase subunit alpha [Bacteroidales bacterium]MCF6342081.1 NAD(P) transhydrogenase subunit alpha [Bacteroidales bacterium]